ncbi:MAG: serine/threonine-protein kinase [Acidobacteriota bacterium]
MKKTDRPGQNNFPNRPRIGPYILLEKLGQGAFGVVWKAKEKGNVAVRPVALKLSIDDEPNLDSILREARIWVKASGHPNVLPIIKAFVHDGKIVIVSEYAQDGSLDKWLKRNNGKAPSLASAVDMISGILSGLDYLHAQTPAKPRIIHRDLKPSNILLQSGVPRISDFGLARELKDNLSPRSIGGTQLYMAPEALAGERSEQTDLWSVGVIFYQLMVGKLPFQYISDISLAAPIPFPDWVPELIQKIVYRALEKNSRQRYQSAADMRTDLKIAFAAVHTLPHITGPIASAWVSSALLQSNDESDFSTLSPNINQDFIQPFGEICCEDEIRILKANYNSYYFNHTPFNRDSIAANTYLIVGRRGSGKSSLANYFKFQTVIKDARCIDVDGPEVYEQVLSQITSTVAGLPEIAIPRIVRIWEFVIWSLIFQEYRDKDSAIDAACMLQQAKMTPANFVREALATLLSMIRGDRKQLADRLNSLVTSERFSKAKEAVLEVTKRAAVIVAIDSLEHFSVNDESMMRAIAALIQCAKQFNDTTAKQGVHIKVFVTEEAFPHIPESVIGNPLKHIRNILYLHWRPRDLISLICWRFFHYLRFHNQLLPASRGKIDWSKFSLVRSMMWAPYFGEELINMFGSVEKTFPYVLRHTQMRPRQLISLCNWIVRKAQQDGTFPRFLPETIVNSIRENMSDLATEVINAYSSTYPNVARILTSLVGLPNRFKGSELDRVAPRTASEWPAGDYTPLKFRELVAELGIVGRIRKFDTKTGIVEADFEYNRKDRLFLQVDDDCVIHPMFYEKLNTKIVQSIHVYPFPEHQDFREIFEK